MSNCEFRVFKCSLQSRHSQFEIRNSQFEIRNSPLPRVTMPLAAGTLNKGYPCRLFHCRSLPSSLGSILFRSTTAPTERADLCSSCTEGGVMRFTPSIDRSIHWALAFEFSFQTDRDMAAQGGSLNCRLTFISAPPLR